MSAVKWIPTPPDLPVMPYSRSCDTITPHPGIHSTSSYWNETYAAPYSVCSAGNATYVYPCCQAMGGEARTACGRVFCLTNGTAHDFFQCVTNGVAKDLNATDYGAMGCHLGYDPKKAEAAGQAPGYLRAACTVLAVSVILGVAAAV